MGNRTLFLILVTFAACGGGGGSGGGGGGGPPPGPLPFGLTVRAPVTGLTFPTSGPQPGQYAVVEAFPNLDFNAPVAITYAPGDRTRLFLAEWGGTIHVFANSPTTSTRKTFLNLGTKIIFGGERGLLGLAFDPDYAANGYFYVCYTAAKAGVNHESIVARYKVSASDPDAADPTSEQILLRFDRPNDSHNMGWLGFGSDGHLYIGSGDGGCCGDPYNGAQSLTTLLGKILRITKTGGIPADNPFVGMGGGVRGEIWAYGFRNPWRLGFDRDTGELWCGDVGQDTREEVSLIVKGGNYGWSIFEGTFNFSNPGGIDINTTEAPVLDYGRNEGSSVTGGYVYRGSDVPSLRGVYVYGDYISGSIWTLVYDGTTVTSNTVIGNVSNPTTFGEDADGEVYICGFGGGIYRIEETGGGGGTTFPDALSETGLFTDVAALTPAPGLIEYEVNAPLWSDGAAKRRWIALPGTAQVGFDPTEAWDFPAGTVVVKHFEIETMSGVVSLETRVLVLEDSGWHGYTYRWNAAQTDALLLAGGEIGTYDVPDASAPGGVRTQTWRFPSRTDCLQCHTAAAGRILGVRARQLNGDFDYPAATDNQLRSWNNIALFTTDIGDHAQFDAMPDPSGTAAPVAARARAYLDANCSMCHRPGGPTPATIDLRYGTALASMNAVDVAPSRGNLGIANARIIASGSKERSVLRERMRRLDSTRMPPLASTVVHQAAADLIGAWIDAGPQ